MNRAAEREARSLMRIAALLLSLANLTERLCRAPFPIRLMVMFLLRPAEAVAREFVAHEFVAQEFVAHQLALPASALIDEGHDLASADEGSDPAAALRLAERFLVLAIALAGFADWLGRCCHVAFDLSKAVCGASVAMAVFAGPADTWEAFDTS